MPISTPPTVPPPTVPPPAVPPPTRPLHSQPTVPSPAIVPPRRAPLRHGTALPAEVPATITVVAWEDPIVERVGFDVASEYVDLFWLSVLGPTSTWLLRHLARGLDRYPFGYEADLAELAATVGVGGPSGPSQQFVKALHRCQSYGVLRLCSDALAVRRRVPPVSARQLARLPAALVQLHRCWVTATDDDAARARQLADAFVAVGDDPDRVERQLIACGITPQTALDVAARCRPAAPSGAPR